MKNFLYKNRNILSTKNFLEKEGIITFKKIAKSSDIEDVYNSLFFLYNKYSNKRMVKYNREDLLNLLKKLRKNNKSAFSKIYDDMQISSATFKLLHSEKVLDIGRALLGQKKNSPIAVSGTMLRLDPPNDGRNLYNWHQDHSYYHQNKSGKNGLVLSVALNKISAQNGALIVALKSHNLKFIKVKSKRKNFSSAQQYLVDSAIFKKFKNERQILDKGDLSAIYLDTIHKSGDNFSSNLRITGLVRVHSILSKDFRSYRDNTYFIDEIKNKKILY